ncbi:glycosyl transferase [Methylobacterium brachythecii]|uniref:Glycosyl transferase n=1 Tax=Methylobacterium brachythecii TaxID=1176177 RepID=A0ABQ6CZF2_9HYPH|nr:glycosyl transferase [Methylobacterium brachythecii]
MHLANHCHEIGNGIMNVAVDIACRQSERGHAVAMASAGGSYVRLLADHGVGHVDLHQNWREPLTLPRAALGLKALIRSWKPDVVHAHMMTGALLARFVRAGASWRLVTTVHNEWQRSAVLMGVGDRVIAVSAAVAEQMSKRRISISRIDVVRNGPLNSPRRAPDGGDVATLSHPAILTVAGLYARKGIGDLITAFGVLAERHPSAALYIVGDGPDRARFEEQARASGLGGRIHFTGFLADPRSYFRGADIFVLASRSEPFGLVIAEAREAGCAVVGSDVGGIPEVLEGGRAGLLVPPGDPETLGRTLCGLLDDPAALARWRAAAVRELDWLDTRRVADETVQVYQHAIDAYRLRLSGRPAAPGTGHPSPADRPAG